MESGIIFGAVCPHAPILVPEIDEGGSAKVRGTRDGMQQLAQIIVDTRPDTVVVASPHGPVVRDAITLLSAPILEGNFREFGISGTSLRFGNDVRLVNRVLELAAELGVNVFAADPNRAPSFRFPGSLHYSVLVPLYYLRQAGHEGRIVTVTCGQVSDETLLAFGRAVGEAAKGLGVRVAYLASGGLSHRLTEAAPAGYDPMGKVHDDAVVSALSRGDFGAILGLDAELVQRAAQNARGPVLTLAGALEGYNILSQVVSYEAPFGVGYCVATFEPTGPAAVRPVSRPSQAEAREAEPVPEPVSEAEPDPDYDDSPADADGPAGDSTAQDGPEADDYGPAAAPVDPLVRLAKLSLETYVRSGRMISPPSGSPGLNRRAGAFVSLKENGELRGCIGTISPTAANLAQEVIQNAVSAGTGDPRFSPVEVSELDRLVYSVDVLEPAEPVSSPAELDPKVYGVIVKKGRRTGLLLPDLEGVDTVEYQVSIAKQKAGIRPDDPDVDLFRFKVSRYH